ncbi:MAG: SIS domain-containing protein [Clostridia bacterium]|nr:SIS domain-containing protein [Clostridia bacterium]
MSKYIEYIENIQSIIEKVKIDGVGSILKTAEVFKDALMHGKKLFLFGTGHSHMLAEELFYRAGGLVEIRPILCEPLMLHESASESTVIERKEGLAESLFDEYGISGGDVIVIISNSGRNGVVVDMALLCKDRGVNVIALTNINHTMSGASRHKSGKRLCEIADIVLDNYGCTGDACIEVSGVEGKICPTSTVIGSLILNCVVSHCVELCAAEGFIPEHFASANIDGGDEINNKLLEKYKKEIKHL